VGSEMCIRDRKNPAVDAAVIDNGFVFGNGDNTALTPTNLQSKVTIAPVVQGQY